MPKTTTYSSSIGTRPSLGCISDKRRTVLRITLAAFAVLLVFSLVAAPASAVEYSSWGDWATAKVITGDGNSEGNAYQIENLDQFVSFRDTVNSIGSTSGKFFKVTEGIDLSSVCGVVIGSWYPIGTSSKPFQGTFNGNEKTISGLYMSYSSDGTNWGLFGYTDGATIKNLGLIGETVIGNDNVGRLVGYMNGGNITYCYATGAVTGNMKVGGLVGNNNGGNITYCYATVTVFDSNTGVGGLVGYNSGNITYCYATGAVEGKDNLGGLVGLNRFDGKIENCYATGAVTGEDSGYVGGLVGENRGKIENCYATGTVTGDHYIGGLAGGNYVNSAILQNSVALNQYVSGNTDVGRVVGLSQLRTSGTIDNCYAWNGMTKGPLTSSLLPSGSSTDKNGTNATSAQVWANPEFYTSLGWDISEGDTTVWKINQDDDSSYPFPYLRTLGIDNSLRAQVEYLNPEVNQYFSGGDGTAGKPFQISSESDLQNLYKVVNETETYDGGKKYNEANYTLTGNLNLGGSAHPWTPIGNDTNPFKGTFNGSNYNISNLYINESLKGDQGLFGSIDGATIKNLGLINVNVTGTGSNIGGLVGYIEHGTIIENCYATGTVTVTDGNHVGGLVGYTNFADINITNSYAAVTVTGKQNVGGLVGRSSGTITNSYATGKVTGKGISYDTGVGGLAGTNGGTNAKIENCYATGAVEVDGENVGGLVGQNDGGTIKNSTALNQFVNATGTNVGRVVGYGSCTNCYAWEGMTNKGIPFTSGGINGTDATSADVWANINFYQNIWGSNNISADGTKVWNISNGGAAATGWTIPYLSSFDVPTDSNLISSIQHLKPINVTFNATGGAVSPSSKLVSRNAAYGDLPTPTKTGYVFAKWQTSVEGGEEVNSTTRVTTAADHILYANWTANVTTLNFTTFGGSAQANITAKYNETLDSPSVPTKTGYTFGGYFIDNNITRLQLYNETCAVNKSLSGYTDENGKWINSTLANGSTVKLYANWTANEYNVTVTPAVNGTIIPNKTSSVHYNEEITLTVTPDTGYELETLTVTDEGNNNVVVSSNKFNMPANNVTVNATFRQAITPSPVQPSPAQPSGGGTDTGSGHYTNYPRTVSDGGSVSFGSSPIVTGVDMPEGVTGSVELITVVVTNTDGREYYATFEINAPKSADGEKSLIYFELDLKKIEADGYTVKDVVLSHNNEDGTWTDLKTTYLGTENGKAKYSAENTVGYSVFAIYYTEGASIENTEPAATPVKTQTAEPVSTYVEPTKTAVPTPEQTKSPVGLVGLGLGLLGAAVVLRRK